MTKDPYRYFRIEAREIVEIFGAGVLELQRGGPDPARVTELLRVAHTLKGAAGIVRLKEIAGRAHTIEAELLAYQAGADDDPEARLVGLARLVRELDAQVRAATAPAERVAVGPIEAWESVRVPIGDLDGLMRAAEEVRLTVVALRSRVAALVEAEDEREKGSHLQRTIVEILDLAESAERAQRQLTADIEALRLVPASTMFSALEGATREAATTIHRRVAISTSGGEVRVDAHVLAGMRDALVQLVRNAVAHGLEPDEERRRLGKGVPGRVDVRVARVGGRAVFSCSDDGRGIGEAALRRAAVARGVAGAADMGLDQLVRLGGVSTRAEVSELAGRGVGLDVVGANVRRLRGEMTLRSEPGVGTAIELSVPTSLTSLVALVVRAGAHVVAVPLESVRHAARVSADDLNWSAGCAQMLWETRSIPFSPLSSLLDPGARANDAWTALVVGSADRVVAVGVDAVLGTERVIVWPLPPLSGAAPGIAGAALDAEGRPRLVLEPADLGAIVGSGATALSPTVRRAPPRLLIVDDSPTTRMLEQSILESAGYQVDVASSGEEGLRAAKVRPYALFLVDVEMPGMDGFSFVARTLADPELRNIPTVLVTSRSGAEDKQRGKDAGARGYVVKSEFVQEELLHIIRSLLGAT